MPNALLVSSSFLPGRGGIESYLAQLCDELAPRLAVLAPAQRDGRPIPTDLAYETSGYPGNMLLPSPRARRAIVETARAHATDRILFGTPWPLVLLGPSLRAAGLRYAVIAHGAEIVVPAAMPLLRRRLARALSTADIILPVSQFTARRVEALLSRFNLAVPPVELLRARVDLDRFHAGADGSVRSRFAIPENARVVLAFGRLVRRKGVDRLIRLMPELRLRIPEAFLVVAGTGPEERHLKRLASAHKDCVRFAGRVADDVAPALYATAQIFVLPVADRWWGLEIEGLGVVLLEAAACATPCVTGRSGGSPEAIVDGESGFVIDARDHRTLLERISHILEHPAVAEQMGRKGRAHVEREFSNRELPAPLVKWLQ